MQLKQNDFSTFELTNEELAIGMHFSMEQKAVIQNLIASYAVDKIEMLYDPQNPLANVQREAEITGAIGALKHLLALSQSRSIQPGE